MSSYECGANVSFDLCNNSTGSCEREKGSTGAGHYLSKEAGHDNMLVRVIMRPYDAAKQGAVVAFKDWDCRGDSGRFDALADVKATAKYNREGMSLRNIGNDVISSVVIPKGYSVRLYDADGCSGSSSIVMDGTFWKNSEDFEMACQNVPSSWNDRVSSLEVYRTFGGNSAVGKWVSVTATEGIDFTYHIGF